MTQAFLVVGGLFLIVFTPLGVLAWRRPLLARFALRESTRRKGQFALLVIGLMAASASITASLVASDSLGQTLTSLATSHLGAVDLTVTSPTGRSFPVDVAQRLVSDPALTPYVDGVQGGLEFLASVSDLDQRLGKPNVLLVGFDPASQRRFGAFDLGSGRTTYGGDLAEGDVLLSQDLANSLDARVGDRLRASAPGGQAADLRVYGIAADTGPGAYRGFQAATSYDGPLTAYVPLATAQLLAGDMDINVVRVAARGASPADDGPARRAAPALRAAVGRLLTATPLSVNELRVESEGQAAGDTGYTLATYLAFSALTVLAAIALIVNLVIALAEERRPRLAILRALGLTRAGLVITSVLEGALYSVAAAIAGVIVGVPAGIYVAQQSLNSFLVDAGGRILGLPVHGTVQPGTLALAFAAGALLTLATVAATAYRTSRMVISAAVRDLPEPATLPGRRWPRIALLLGVALCGGGLLIPNDGRSRLLGGFLLIAAVAGMARGRLPDRARATLFGLGTSALAGIIVAIYSTQAILDVTIVTLGLAIPAVGLSIAVAANLRFLDAGLGRLGNRLSRVQAALRPPLAYLSRRPLRTGLAASAFAVVLALVTLGAVFIGSAVLNYDRESAGFDILAVTSSADSVQLPPDVEQQVTGRMTLPMRIYRGPLSGLGYIPSQASTEMTFYVLPDEPADAGPIALDNLDSRFHNSADAWQAVRSEPNLVIGPGNAGASPGDEIVIAGKSGPVHLRVAAISASPLLYGIVASKATVDNLDTAPGGSTVVLALRPGSDARALAHQIASAGFAQGVQATSIRDLFEQGNTASYTSQFDALLYMGLLVGVLALAMIGIRAAVERRRAIGILRALGYQPPSLLVGLVTEAALLATLGVMSGIGAGLVTAYFLVHNTGILGARIDISVDVPRMAIALAIVYGTVVLVTGPLASRAARMAPAEAVRLID